MKEDIQEEREKESPELLLREERTGVECHLICAIIAAWKAPLLAINPSHACCRQMLSLVRDAALGLEGPLIPWLGLEFLISALE